MAVGPNWLVAKMAPGGDYRVFTVAPNKTAMIDGAPKTVSQLQTGTMLTADVTITEYPLVKRTTTVNSGKVFWASPTSLIITQENGENKHTLCRVASSSTWMARSWRRCSSGRA